jgi:hypothetical protein
MTIFRNPIIAKCVIHSLAGELDEAKIIGILDAERYIAEYKGVKCTAISNVFNGLWYVDDKYGILPDDWKERYGNG